ncbi:MAG: EAL domain-containing protein [Deltaproteobacteria bacterium]|nr:EAL domain-containing protein [Deltaproteobacteria bacterium]
MELKDNWLRKNILSFVLIATVVASGFALMSIVQYSTAKVNIAINKQVENVAATRELGQIINRDLAQIFAEFYQILAAKDAEHQAPVFNSTLSHIVEIQKALDVLSIGGTIDYVISLNEPRHNSVQLRLHYVAPFQHYNVPVLTIRPLMSTLLDALEQAVNLTATRNSLLTGNDVSALLVAAKRVHMHAERTEVLLVRIQEDANQLAYDSHNALNLLRQQRLESLQQGQRNNILASMLTVLGVLGVIALIYRQKLVAYRQLNNTVVLLQQADQELQDTNIEILTLNRSLEDKVTQRTKDLQTAEQQWSDAFDAISYPMFIHDHNGRITKVNRAYLERANCEIDAAYGQPYWEVFPKMATPLPGCIVDSEAGETVSCAQELDLQIDEQIYRSQSFVLNDAQGEFLYSLHLLEDVTSSRAAHEALLKSERRFQDITNSMDEVLILIDRDMNVQFMNSASLLAYGVEEQGYRGVPCYQLLWQRSELCVNCPAADVLRDGNVGRAMRYMPDGKIFARSIYPVHDHAGNITACAVLATDVTQQEIHLQELTRYEQILSTNTDAIAYFDDQHVCIAMNEVMAKNYGNSVEYFVGKHMAQIIGAARYKFLVPPIETMISTVQPLEYDALVPFPTLGRRYMHVIMTPYVGEGGQVSGIVVRMQDITDKAEQEAKLRLSAKVFESTSEGITITNTEGTITAVNAAFCTITGYSQEEVLGGNPRILKSGRHDQLFYQLMWADLKATGHWHGEIWNKRKNGDIYPEILTISSIFDEDGHATHYVAVFSDITAMNDVVKQLDYQAHHHTVTDLPNRRLLHARLTHSLQLAKREQHQGAVFYLDLDNFKHINDSLGHDLGDRVLVEVAQRLLYHSREVDTVAHISGDEFAVVLHQISTVAAAGDHAEQLLARLQQPMVVDGHELFICGSIGIAVFPDDGDSVASLLKNADVAMYQAKEQGKNSYCLYVQNFTDDAVERMRLENSLRRALQNDEFVLYYQPQISLVSGEIVGCEALVRWIHPERGLVPPDKFIPLCEENGLIVPMGEWILRTACLQWLSWQQQGFNLGRISVNLSGRQIQQDDLPQMIAGVLEETGCPVSALELEITETFLMKQPERAITVLRQIRDSGIELAIDDFGTGQASLNYLKRFPVDRLKIDRSFVNDIQHGNEDCAIVTAIIAMGHGLGLSIIAEGIETTLQQQFLSDLHCEEAQGYLFSRPVPAAEFAVLLKSV